MPQQQSTISTTGRGAVVSLSLDGSIWTPIDQFKNISFSGPKSNFDSTTNVTSPGAIEEFQPTTIDPGTATMEVVWNQVSAGQQMLAAQFYLQTLCYFKVQYPAQVGLTTGPLTSFRAYVAENGLPSLDISKTTTYSVQLKISGEITTAAGIA